MMLAFIAVTTVLGSSKIRGLASLGIGLLIGTVGIDPTSGQQRLTLGIPELADGIDVVVVAVGPVRRRRGALGRGPPAPQARRDHPRRRRPDEPRGLAALLEALAARHR